MSLWLGFIAAKVVLPLQNYWEKHLWAHTKNILAYFKLWVFGFESSSGSQPARLSCARCEVCIVQGMQCVLYQCAVCIVQGVQYVLCKVCSVYFYRVCSVTFTSKSSIKIWINLTFSETNYYRNPGLVQYKEGLYVFETNCCVFVSCTRCLVCIAHSAYLQNLELTKRILISNVMWFLKHFLKLKKLKFGTM